jgi:hypothetical protein
MVSKSFVCENIEKAGVIKVEELPGNFVLLWLPRTGVSLYFMVPHLLCRVAI